VTLGVIGAVSASPTMISPFFSDWCLWLVSMVGVYGVDCGPGDLVPRMFGFSNVVLFE
jgi:hypothetical protein